MKSRIRASADSRSIEDKNRGVLPPVSSGKSRKKWRTSCDLDRVVLVDGDDRSIGSASKLAAHRRGQLHRAVSVFLFNRRRELLMQQRATGKYHSGGLWSNTCCGHPRPGEDLAVAALRKLDEELGITCEVRPAGCVSYRLRVSGGLIEHEIDHLFWGRFDGDARPNPDEIACLRWVPVASLMRDLKQHPQSYTPWLHHIAGEWARLHLY